MFRVQHYVFVFINYVDDMQFDAQGFGHPQCIVAFGFFFVAFAYGVGLAFYTKTGEEINAFDMDALLHHHLGGEQGIESTRNERNGFGLRHD